MYEDDMERRDIDRVFRRLKSQEAIDAECGGWRGILFSVVAGLAIGGAVLALLLV